MSRWAADAVLVVHLLFVLFVCLGGLLVFRWPRAAWFHLPAAAWGALIEFAGWICPLTPLEDALRGVQGEVGPGMGFIERTVTVVLYPDGLTRGAQIALGAGVLFLNACIYGFAIFRRVRRPPKPISPSADP